MRIIAAAIAFSALSLSPLPAHAFIFGKGPICIQQHQPVCGSRGRLTRTYPNACVARSEGAKVIASGPCRRVARVRRAEPPQHQDGPSLNFDRN